MQTEIIFNCNSYNSFTLFDNLCILSDYSSKLFILDLNIKKILKVNEPSNTFNKYSDISICQKTHRLILFTINDSLIINTLQASTIRVVCH